MAYAPSFTSRYVAKYRSAGVQHEIMIRGYLGESQTTTSNRGRTALRALFDALTGKLSDDFLWISAKYIPEDSESSFPETVPLPITGALALATFSKQDRSGALHFPGKCTNTIGGLSVFGLQFATDTVPDSIASDYLITADEDTDIANAITALNGAAIPGIDGTKLEFYNQATWKPHDVYVKKVRRGSL